MLLYQLTQWVEERSSLQKALHIGSGDSGQLQTQIQEVEAQLYAQAERWKTAIDEASVLRFPYEAPHLDDDSVL